MDTVPLNIRYAELAATRLGCDFEVVDTFSRYVARVSNEKSSIFVGAGTVSGYAINNAAASTLVTDKSHTYGLLAKAGIATPRSQLVFVKEQYADMRPAGREIEDGVSFAEAIGYPVFVKPNQGSRGVLARSVNNETTLRSHLQKTAQSFHSAVIQEVLEGEEGRLFYIDGEPVFSYRKTQPELVGNGRSRLDQLLSVENERLERQGLSPLNDDDRVLVSAMEKQQLTLASVLKEGQKITCSEKANSSYGGGVFDFKTSFTTYEKELCRKVYEVSGLRVCAIDFMCRNRQESEPVVIELNCNPALTTLEKLGKVELLTGIWETVISEGLAANAR